jgi:hypothetical protein
MTTAAIILAPTKLGGTSKTFQVGKPSRDQTVTVQVNNLATTETATLQWQDFANQQWYNYFSNGVVEACTSTNSALHISCSGNFRVVLSATAASVGVSVLSDLDIFIV